MTDLDEFGFPVRKITKNGGVILRKEDADMDFQEFARQARIQSIAFLEKQKNKMINKPSASDPRFDDNI